MKFIKAFIFLSILLLPVSKVSACNCLYGPRESFEHMVTESIILKVQITSVERVVEHKSNNNVDYDLVINSIRFKILNNFKNSEVNTEATIDQRYDTNLIIKKQAEYALNNCNCSSDFNSSQELNMNGEYIVFLAKDLQLQAWLPEKIDGKDIDLELLQRHNAFDLVQDLFKTTPKPIYIEEIQNLVIQFILTISLFLLVTFTSIFTFKKLRKVNFKSKIIRYTPD